MAMVDGDNPGFDSFDGCLDVKIEKIDCVDNQHFVDKQNPTNSCKKNIPKPPLPPPPVAKAFQRNNQRYVADYCNVPIETRDTWVRILKEGYGTDVNIVTADGSIIPAHFCVLSAASPVLQSNLLLSKPSDGIRYLHFPGVTSDAVYIFIGFLYSAWYNEEGLKKHVLHLLVLSHSCSVPSLKKVCLRVLEHDWLTTENVIDVLQLARKCDAPRLSLICVRMIIHDIKTIRLTEGWKVMIIANPALEQELLESLVESNSRKKERERKANERKMYLELYEAMEALIHICEEGCRTIGPCNNKVVKQNTGVSCGYPACKTIEMLLRHFSGCKSRVPGNCVHCKRMWQFIELHSRMCNHPDLCMVPLCRHFKDKMKNQSKKEVTTWRLLVSRMIAARNFLGPFLPRHNSFL